MSSQAALAKGRKKPHPGENKLNLTPAIRFFVPQDDDTLARLEEKKTSMITIKVKVDPEETDSKLNQVSLKFPKIEIFVKNGPEVAEVQLKLHNKIFLPQDQTGPKDVDKRLGTFKRICVDEAKNAFIAEINLARIEFINKYSTKGSELKKKLLEARDKEFFDWLRLDVVDAKQAQLNRFKEHTETMKETVAFDSTKRTAQFAAIQDDIAMLFDSSSSDSSSSDSEENEAQKQHEIRQEQRKQGEKKAKRKKARELVQAIEADKVCHKAEEEAFKAEVADETVDNGLPKVGTLACISFENHIWFNLGMLLWVNHRDCFEEQLCYL